MNKNFEQVLEDALNATPLFDVEKFGYCHIEETYKNEVGQIIKIAVYELDSETYLIRYVNNECVLFRNITALKKEKRKPV